MSDAFGIDFGTSNSVVGRYIPEASRSETIEVDSVVASWGGLNLENVLPSVVAHKDGGFLFGWAAKFSEADRIDAVKRLLERDEPVALGDEQFPPGVLAAGILRHLRSRALVQGLLMDSAVISIPANATGRQRLRTLQAAQRAGIRALRLINEPTAAALSFMSRLTPELQQAPSSVLVFDWGGGTLDVTILEHRDGVFQEVASDGIPRVGGLEFDARFRELVQKKVGRELENYPQIAQAVERAKIDLSRDESVDLLIGGTPVTVERDEFDESTKSLVGAAMSRVKGLLNEYSGGIDWVVPVGGTSMIPAVRDALSAETGRDLARTLDFNPLTAVAEGAAVAAAIASGQLDSQLHLVMANDMGIASYVRSLGLDAHHLSPIIRRGTPIPYRASKSYRMLDPELRKFIRIDIVEGSAYLPVEHEDNSALATVRFGSPYLRDGSERFTVDFTYDKDALMHVKVVSEKGATLTDEDVVLDDGDNAADAMRLLERLGEQPGEAPSAPVVPSGPVVPSAPVVVVDGSNVGSTAAGRNTGRPVGESEEAQVSWTGLREVVSAFEEHVRSEGLDPGAVEIVVDANFRHLLSLDQRREFDEAAQRGEVVVPPSGTHGSGDSLILAIAQKKMSDTGVIILTNDGFKDRNFRKRFEELFWETRKSLAEAPKASCFGVTVVTGAPVFTQRSLGTRRRSK